MLGILLFVFLPLRADAEEVYFKAIHSSPIYDNSSGSLVEVGVLEKDAVFKISRDYGPNWLEIEVGGMKRYIYKANTAPAVSDGKIKESTTLPYKYTLTSDVTVYENINGQLTPILILKNGQTILSNSPVGSTWIQIDVSGRVGHLYHTGVKAEFTPSHHYFEIIGEEVPFYDNRTGALVESGTLKSGTVFKRVRDYSANWHEIEIGGQKRYVGKFATKPALKNQGADQSKGTFATQVTLTTDADLYENQNGQLVPIGKLKTGETVLSTSSTGGNWYRVFVSGREGFLYHTAVTPKSLPKDVVNPYQTYSYGQMIQDMNALKNMYPDLISTQVIGQSVDGRNLIALKLGKGSIEITANASHHAREHMTTNVLMEMIDQYAYAYTTNSHFSNYPVRNILDKVSIWFVPMVNPDGVTLVQKGPSSAKNPQNVIAINGGSKNFSSWKANIRGVDLNRQYDANWPNIVNDPGKPSSENYKGPAPFSESESKAMRDFVLAHPFEAGIAYHSSGEIIYWSFKQTGSEFYRDQALAKKVSQMTGYSLGPVRKNPSGGGFTDWFIQNQKKPSITPEIAPYVGKQPVPIRHFTDVWNRNKAVVIMLADYASKL